MRSVLLLAVLIVALVALLPPFFTHGACTAEFDAVSTQFERAKGRELSTASRVQAYLNAQAIPYQVTEAPPCVARSPTDILSCPAGPKILAAVPVKNLVCRFYRDDSIRVQLEFNNHRQLTRIQTDMKPYRIYNLALFNLEIYWAR